MSESKDNDLGITEDAAQKRVSKAIEALSRFFRRRGFAVPAFTLSASFLGGATRAAPGGLAGLVAQTVVRQAALAPLSKVAFALMKVMTMTKTQTALVCALIGAAPVAVQWHNLDQARAEETKALSELELVQSELGNTDSELSALLSRKARAESSLVLLQQAGEQRAVAAARTESAQPEFYPWSEESAFVRVPKSLLSRVDLRGVVQTNNSTFELSDALKAVLRLSPEAADGIQFKMADVEHRFRLAQAQYFEPSEDHVILRTTRDQEPPVEMVSYKLNPFLEEGARFRDELHAGLLSELGEERYPIFRRHVNPFINGRFLGFGGHTQGIVRATFDLRLDPDFKIGFRRESITPHLHGGGQSWNQLRTIWEPHEDQYAPASLQPTLAQWRSRIEAARSESSGGQP